MGAINGCLLALPLYAGIGLALWLSRGMPAQVQWFLAFLAVLIWAVVMWISLTRDFHNKYG